METPRAAGAPTPRPRAALRGVTERALRVPLLGKLAGANLIIVAAALLAVGAILTAALLRRSDVERIESGEAVPVPA